VKKSAENQMTLPMHSSNGASVASVQTLPAFRTAEAVPTPITVSSSTPVSEPIDAVDTDVEFDEPELLHYPPPASLLTPAPVFAQVSAGVSLPHERPVIRPAVASPIAPASVTSSARRTVPASATSLASAHLGIEESEFDKPTYLRRAMAGDGMRHPGDHK